MSDLRTRMEEIGRRLGEREAPHASAMAEARGVAGKLHARLAEALQAFHAAAAGAGAGHLAVDLSEPRLDDKHVRSVELELSRGRHRGIVVVKSRGDVTLVGPFRTGKDEGPCRTLAWDAEAEIDAALGEFLEQFLEAAATP